MLLRFVLRIKKAFFEKLANPTTGTKKFWSVIRLVNPRKVAPSALSHGSVTAYDNEAKANLLNEYVASCFNTATVPTTRSFFPDVTDVVKL